jgi:hypothetical protein
MLKDQMQLIKTNCNPTITKHIISNNPYAKVHYHFILKASRNLIFLILTLIFFRTSNIKAKYLFQKPNFKLPTSLHGPLQTIKNATISITISKINPNIVKDLDAHNVYIMFLGMYGWNLGCKFFLAPQKFPSFGTHYRNLIWLHI